jgi:hypothetical protein
MHDGRQQTNDKTTSRERRRKQLVDVARRLIADERHWRIEARLRIADALVISRFSEFYALFNKTP